MKTWRGPRKFRIVAHPPGKGDGNPASRKPPNKATSRAVVVIRKTLQAVADSVNARLTHVVEDLVASGRELREAKREHKGEFLRLFREHPYAVDNPLRCSSRHAQRLMRLADLVDAVNPTALSDWPQQTTALWALTELPVPVVKSADAEGLIHLEMHERDVRLLKEPRKAKPAAKRESPPVTDDEIKEEIRRVIEGWWKRYAQHLVIRAYLEALLATQTVEALKERFKDESTSSC